MFLRVSSFFTPCVGESSPNPTLRASHLFGWFFLAVLLSFAANAQPKVIATFPALQSLAAMVMEGVTSPAVLLNRQQDAHHMQLKPSQMQAVMQADLFVYYDPGFEIFVPKLASASHKTAFLALSDVLDRQPHRESNHGWLNPDYAIAMVHYLSVELMRIDPTHAAIYEKNAEKYAAEIEEHASRWRASLGQGATSPKQVVVDHNAFAGFTNYFGLSPAIALEERGGEISVSRLKEIEKKPIGCLIATHGKSGIMERLAAAGNARINTTLNPLGTQYPAGIPLYFQLMDDLVQEFEGCLL